MPLIPIDLKPGVYKNGTPYSGKLRWADSNLVRWKDGAIRVIGGWEQRTDADDVHIPSIITDPTTEAARNIISWVDNLEARHIVIGTNKGLYRINSSGTIFDITPVGLTPGNKDSGLIVGYGTFAFGKGTFGTPRTGTGAIPDVPASWSFSIWGENLLAQFRNDGPLYQWVPGASVATPIATAPTGMQGILVTAQRIVMGINGGAEPRLVSWSASENNADWTPAVTNQAGSQELAGVGPLLAITQIMNEVIIIGQNDVNIARYLGPPYVYGFERVGENSGLLSANAVVTTDRYAFWIAERNFWVYDGSLKKLESEIIDFFYSDLKLTESAKTFGFAIRDFNEVWWLYQSKDSTTTEPDSYICYDYALNHWTKGKLDRSVGMDKYATATPIMVSSAGIVYNHELVGTSIEDGPIPYCETGPMELGQGDQQVYMDYLYPDEYVAGDLNMTIISQAMPNLPQTEFGPYALTSPTPVRVRGRQLALRFEGRAAGWKIGIMRANVKPGGKR